MIPKPHLQGFTEQVSKPLPSDPDPVPAFIEKVPGLMPVTGNPSTSRRPSAASEGGLFGAGHGTLSDYTYVCPAGGVKLFPGGGLGWNAPAPKAAL